ncbi:MAG: hypothetical protein ACFFB5_17780 [Promethearchaeota archaeon]
MSWREFDKTLNKLFESFQKETKASKEISESNDLNQATSRFTKWLEEHIQECRIEEEFPRIRLICIKCGEKITDDRFVVILHPDFPVDYSKSFYLHSKGKCTPRWDLIRSTREKWLREHDKTYQERERKRKALIEALLSHF